jgi:hypothetical protein
MWRACRTCSPHILVTSMQTIYSLILINIGIRMRGHAQGKPTMVHLLMQLTLIEAYTAPHTLATSMRKIDSLILVCRIRMRGALTHTEGTHSLPHTISRLPANGSAHVSIRQPHTSAYVSSIRQHTSARSRTRSARAASRSPSAACPATATAPPFSPTLPTEMAAASSSSSSSSLR